MTHSTKQWTPCSKNISKNMIIRSVRRSGRRFAGGLQLGESRVSPSGSLCLELCTTVPVAWQLFLLGSYLSGRNYRQTTLFLSKTFLSQPLQGLVLFVLATESGDL